MPGRSAGQRDDLNLSGSEVESSESWVFVSGIVRASRFHSSFPPASRLSEFFLPSPLVYSVLACRILSGRSGMEQNRVPLLRQTHVPAPTPAPSCLGPRGWGLRGPSMCNYLRIPRSKYVNTAVGEKEPRPRPRRSACVGRTRLLSCRASSTYYAGRKREREIVRARHTKGRGTEKEVEPEGEGAKLLGLT